MSETITIGGVAVSASDPCAIAAQLKIVKLRIVAGESVAMTRFDQDEVRFTPASLSALNAEIANYERECALSVGAAPRRRARTALWR